MADEKVICIVDDVKGNIYLLYDTLERIQSVTTGVNLELIDTTRTTLKIYYAKNSPELTKNETIQVISPTTNALKDTTDSTKIKAFQIKANDVDYNEMLAQIQTIMNDLITNFNTLYPTIAGKLADIISQGPTKYMKKGGKKRYRSYHKPSTSRRRSKKRATRGRKNKRQSRRRA